MTFALAVVGGVAAGLVTAVVARTKALDTAHVVLVGLASAALAGWSALTVAPPVLPAFLVLAAFWGSAAVYDLANHRLPDSLTLIPLPIFFVLLVPDAIIGSDWSGVLLSLVGALTTAAVLFVLAFINPRGLGLGDVKLGLTTGAALGWFGLPAAFIGLAAAFVLMAVASVVLLITKRLGRKDEVPFGPFLVVAAVVSPMVTPLVLGAG